MKPVIIHNNNPQISKILDKLSIKSKFKNNLQITTPKAIDVVHMMLVGQMQRELIDLINQHGHIAIGLSNKNTKLFTTKTTNTIINGEEINLKLIGKIAEIHPKTIKNLVETSRIPMISSIAPNTKKIVHNINADTATATLTIALNTKKLIILTNIKKLYQN